MELENNLNNEEIKVENLVTKLDKDLIPSVAEQLLEHDPLLKAIFEAGEKTEEEDNSKKQEQKFDEEMVQERISRMRAKQDKKEVLKKEQDKKKKNNRQTLTPFPNPYLTKR